MRTLGRLDDGTEIGAWLLVADPDTWDTAAFVGDGEDIEQWPLDDETRAAMVHPGDPCVVWVTGAVGSDIASGLWAIGEITDRPDAAHVVEIDVQLFGDPIPASVFAADDRFAGAEVFGDPPRGNPQVLTPDQYAYIEDHLDAGDLWPADPELDALLDEAEDIALARLEQLGWSIEENDDPPTLMASRDGIETEVFLAVVTGGDGFVLGVEEFDELLWEGEGVLLVVVSFESDESAEVLTVEERWVPTEDRFDRRTQRYRFP